MAITVTLPLLQLALIDLRSNSCIALSDLSTYSALPTSGYYSVQCTPPDYPTVNLTWTPGNVNIYKCVDLGITCNDTPCTALPDGIYEVVYTVLPMPGQNFTQVTIDQKFIKIDHIKCKYQTAFLKIDLECICHDHKYYAYIKEMQRIKLYIDGSVAACNDTNYALSYQLYTKANCMLDKLGCKQYTEGILWHNPPLGCNIC